MLNRITSQFIWGVHDDFIGSWPERWSPAIKQEQLVRLAGRVLTLSRLADVPPPLRSFENFLVNLLAAQEALLSSHHGHEESAKAPLALRRLLLDELGLRAERFHPERD
jgi:hypothetical protein